jgi:hypothetical protein
MIEAKRSGFFTEKLLSLLIYVRRTDLDVSGGRAARAGGVFWLTIEQTEDVVD